jgi:hypothetical protein
MTNKAQMAYFLLNPDIGLSLAADLYNLGVMEYWSSGVLKSMAGTEINRNRYPLESFEMLNILTGRLQFSSFLL